MVGLVWLAAGVRYSYEEKISDAENKIIAVKAESDLKIIAVKAESDVKITAVKAESDVKISDAEKKIIAVKAESDVKIIEAKAETERRIESLIRDLAYHGDYKDFRKWIEMGKPKANWGKTEE